MSRIQDTFNQAAQDNRAAFIPFMTAGFPDEKTFLANAHTLLELGDILEVGLPYSDPLGDGPTIQKSSEAALAEGVTTAKVFKMIEALRQHSDKPIVLMTYYNPIFCYASHEEGFLKDLKACGADGIILPDLPPDEGQALIEAALTHNIDTIFLVAPTSTDARLARVTQDCRGFVYAVSVTGVTGAREGLPHEVPSLVTRTKEVCDLPVAVGFGVKNAQTAAPVAAVADGVVVGSALVSAAANGEKLRQTAQEIKGACQR